MFVFRFYVISEWSGIKADSILDDPIQAYLNVAALGGNFATIQERVHSKAYRQMRNHCANTLMLGAEESLAASRLAGNKHTRRWGLLVGYPKAT